MYAIFHNQQFANFANGTVTATTQARDAVHAVNLPEDQVQRVLAIYRSGVTAAATLRRGSLVITPTTTPRPVHARIPNASGSGAILIKDLHRLSVAVAGRRIAEDSDAPLTVAEAQAQARQAVRELLEVHPAPSREHLLETFAGLWQVAHAHFRNALRQGLLTALTALGEADPAETVTTALAALTRSAGKAVAA